MNKKLIFTSVFIILAVLVFACLPKVSNSNNAKREKTAATEVGIQFMESDWNKALQEAKKQNKPIFLDAYTSWCGPCKMLKNNTFTDKAVGEYFNKNFINVALDMEKGDGIAVAEKYQIRAYPTLIITDADQKSVSVSEGYINPSQLIEFGKYVVDRRNKLK
ncbi:MAG: thioredoxin family protein [Ferruginibacter sp.]